MNDRRRVRHPGFVIFDNHDKPTEGIVRDAMMHEWGTKLNRFDDLLQSIYDTEDEAQVAIAKLKTLKEGYYKAWPYEPRLSGVWATIARMEDEPDNLAIIDLLVLLTEKAEIDYDDKTDVIHRLTKMRQSILSKSE